MQGRSRPLAPINACNRLNFHAMPGRVRVCNVLPVRRYGTTQEGS